ncbi:MAG: CRISPR-associated endonuclease Cas2 [Treponema sp.]|nr:CRISPR-associated endonuclease Cas2 [Treponema sp.]
MLKEALLKIINKKQDSIRIYPICEDCIRETSTLGEGDIFVPKNFLIL